MLFSAILGVLVLVGITVFNGTPFANVLQKVELYDFEEFLMKGVLCFMLFAGSCHHKTKDMIKSLRQISVLAVVRAFQKTAYPATLQSAVRLPAPLTQGRQKTTQSHIPRDCVVFYNRPPFGMVYTDKVLIGRLKGYDTANSSPGGELKV